MSEMVERVARAIIANDDPNDDPIAWDELTPLWRENAMKCARAAIEAMRPKEFGDLPESVAQAGESAIDRCGPGSYAAAHDVFASMLDAALKD
jgi:hypothetical protein